MRSAIRSRSSTAALRLKVRTRMRSGSVPLAMRAATASTSVVVLPVPGPARTSSGPCTWSTTARCRASRRGGPPGPAGYAPVGTRRGSPVVPGGATGSGWRKRSSRGSLVLVGVLGGRGDGRPSERGGGCGVRAVRAVDATPSSVAEAGLPSGPPGPVRHGCAAIHERTRWRRSAPLAPFPPYGPQAGRAGTRWRELSGVRFRAFLAVPSRVPHVEARDVSLGRAGGFAQGVLSAR